MTSTPDAVLASAVDLARAAVLEIAPQAEHVGDHVEAVAEDDHLVTHYFVCLDRGYRGWRWAASLARTPGSDDVSVAEVVLLPGSDSLLAPAWVPWEERVRPGDLGPGDLHPTPLDDPRLEPGFSGADALDAADETTVDVAPLRPEQWQLGLGRETVLSPYGRGVAADRWYDGDFGPESPMAKAAPAHCASCGFLLPIGGSLGQVFGACANPLGADGRIVALGYGCGAHSSVRPIDGTGVPVTGIAVDDGVVEVVDLAALPAPRPVVDDETDDLEPLRAPEAPAAEQDEAGVDDAVDDGRAIAVDDPAFLDADSPELAALAEAETALDDEDDDEPDVDQDAADDDLEDELDNEDDRDDVEDSDDSDDDDDESDDDESDDGDDESDDPDDDDESDDDESDDEDDDDVEGSELDDVEDIEPDEVLG